MRSYECSECGMAFAWKSTYTKHVAQHSIPDNAEPTILIQCTQQGCDKRYKTVGQMQEHVKRDHFMIRRFHCDDCDKQFYKVGLQFKYFCRLTTSWSFKLFTNNFKFFKFLIRVKRINIFSFKKEMKILN